MSKFYPLQHDEWLKACKELNESEKDVLYYIRTLDPYSKGTEINASMIAKKIGVHRSTISRSLRSLADKKYIDLEILTANVVIKGKGSLHPCNSVAPMQQTPSKPVAPMQQCCTHATSVAPMQHDTPQSGSGQGTVFSKISLDRSNRSDRSSDFDFSENSDLEAIATNEDLKPDQSDELTNTPEKEANPIEGDPLRRRVEDFILKTLQVSPRDRTAYFSRFTAADWQKWETKMNPPELPRVSQRDPITEDPWRLENAIASMAKCKDFEAIENRLNNLLDQSLAQTLREKYLCN